MPVTIQGHTSNKASQKAGSPDPALFTSAIEGADGKKIWRSIPQPDKITFATVLTEEHFGGKAKTPLYDKAVIKGFAEGLTGAVGTHAGKAVHFPADQIPKVFKIPFGPREAQAFITLKSTNGKDHPAPFWTLRIEFNPRKLKSEGHTQLLETLAYASPGPIDVDAILRDARISRLDVAVDLFSVRPEALLLTTMATGKRQEIFGPDGRLETIYLYGPKKKPAAPLKALRKPFGALVLKVYDRNRERAAWGKPPPYPGGFVTRLEASVSRFGKQPYLYSLLALPYPFKRVKVSLTADVLAKVNSGWLRYWSARQTFGPDVSIAATGLSLSAHKALEKAIKNNPSTLLSNDAVWSEWHAGLKSCGLDQLINAAINCNG